MTADTHYTSNATMSKNDKKQHPTKHRAKLAMRVNAVMALTMVVAGVSMFLSKTLPFADQYLFWYAVGVASIMIGANQGIIAWRWMKFHATIGGNRRFLQAEIPNIGDPAYIKMLLRANPSVRYMTFASDISIIAEKIGHIVGRAKGVSPEGLVGPIPQNIDILGAPKYDMEDMLFAYLDSVAFIACLDLSTIRRNDDENNYYCLTLHDVNLSILFWVGEDAGKQYYFMYCVDTEGKTDLSVAIRDAVASVM